MAALRKSNYIPRFECRKNLKKWRIRFKAGDISEKVCYKFFNTEQEAKDFVLNIHPDAYDEKLETERKCLNCKQILPIKIFFSKNICRDCTKIRRVNRDNDRRSLKLCSFASCSKEKLKNASQCFEHWFERTSSKHFSTKKYAMFLINLYEKQNRKCPYTGKHITPNNMSLDHIISRYDRIDLAKDINNVQWVHRDINIMKSKFSHDAFIKICKHIANRFT